MKRHTPWMGLILSLALVMTAVFPARAAEEEVPFSDFRIDAGGMDFLEQQVSIHIYRQQPVPLALIQKVVGCAALQFHPVLGPPV